MGYIEDLDKYLKQSKLKLNKKEQQEILRVYNKAFDSMLKQYKNNIHKKNATQIARTAYCKQIHNEILSIIKEYNIKVTDDIINGQVDALMQGVEYYKDTELYKNVMKQANIVNRQVVEQMIKGSIYKDGQGLSKRLWKDVNASGDKIEEAIMSMIAEGKGSTEIAKNLTQFAKGGHRTWDKIKIKEKLGSSYAGKYGGKIDYEALRLARTTLNHQAQLTQKSANQVNPYAQKLKYHSAHQADRTCQQCIDRDGKIFDIDKCPLDHPNGMCHMEVVYCINGKEVSSTQMAEDIGKWIRGEENSGTMDILYKNIPLEDMKVYSYIKNSGANYGAYNDDNDPYQEKRDLHAEMYYESVRNRDKYLEIKTIARNTGFKEKDIEKVYSHVFVNKYKLEGGLKRFDPDYDMACSWARLREGKNIQEHDIIMLKHERLEYYLMKRYNLSYRDAHDIVEPKYNYKKAIDAFNYRKKGV